MSSFNVIINEMKNKCQTCKNTYLLWGLNNFEHNCTLTMGGHADGQSQKVLLVQITVGQNAVSVDVIHIMCLVVCAV